MGKSAGLVFSREDVSTLLQEVKGETASSYVKAYSLNRTRSFLLAPGRPSRLEICPGTPGTRKRSDNDANVCPSQR